MLDTPNFPQIIDIHYGPRPSTTVPNIQQFFPETNPPLHPWPCWCEHPLHRIIREQQETIDRLKQLTLR